MLKMLLIAGHGEGDPGALGNGYQEWDVNRKLVKAMSGCFKEADVLVDVYDTDKNCYKQIKKGNIPEFFKYHYVCEVHLNASANKNVNGSMVYISQSETGHSVEDKILQNLYGLGFAKAWDGVVIAQRQWKNGLLVQETCRQQGVSHTLLETCFITNKEDMEKLNIEKTAQAVADGIIDGFKVRKKEFIPYMVKVTDPALNIRSGPGTDYSINGIIADKGTYTIIGEKNGKGASSWGRLKSGIGWISLDYTRKA